ncbi:hypothetical protein CspeluHIS016_0901860 [Cutaneotrichosporon spelunceum]|uniref:Uncharacterized protein n=1 Tax=Cutaneotrichosporon spelunceum TaxID=1672016 RepID=A0AAD3TZX9_9TREE|nr:hypothetical protein CspeluHIS016_0901860 [Cutaneotrichosporon spelunceum]
MVKRETTTSRTPSPVPKKSKTAKSTPSKPSALGEGRAILVEEIVTLGIAAAQANAASLVQKTGLTPGQIKNQLSPGRSNVRKALLEAAKTA